MGVIFFGIFSFLFFKYIWGGIIFEAHPQLIQFLVFILIPNKITTPLLLIYSVFIIVRVYLYRQKYSKLHGKDDGLTAKSNKNLFLKKIFLSDFSVNLRSLLLNLVCFFLYR